MPGLFGFLKRRTVAAPPSLPAPATPPTAAPATPPPVWTVEAALRTDVGCRRTNNEDHIRFVAPHADDPRAARGALLVVADGMGGQAAGEVASSLAVETVFRVFYGTDAPPSEALRTAFETANAAVWQAGQQPDTRGMGTTVTALLIEGDRGHVAHVGDSRLYRLRDGALRQITHDHSLVQEMVRKGLLAPEQAAHHEDRNILLQALGNRASVTVEVLSEPLVLLPGDVFLACSDGLHDDVSPDELAALLTQAPDVQQAADALVSLAKERGGLDNISVGVVRLVREPRAAPPPRPTREYSLPPVP